MTFRKQALLSPAVNAQQAMPSEEDEKRLFEDKFSQMAYQVFTSKFPDLVVNIVTFKILDSDLEKGTAVGAFILEQNNEYIYVPSVLSDNQLKPFDIMYVKSKDIFLPLTSEWISEVGKSTLASMGEGVELPDTVATDVDIRNIIVPPTTGRYSYASAVQISPRNRMFAEATEPLGRQLTKIAMGPFPDMGGGAPGGMGSGNAGGSGAGTAEDFNPEIWATFVEQFQRIQQTTPGQALDGGVLDLDTLSKMYKSHMKTWEMAQQAGQMTGAIAPDPNMQAQAAMQAGAPLGAQSGAPTGGSEASAAGPMGPGTAGLMPEPKLAAVPGAKAVSEAAHTVPYKTMGKSLNDITSAMGLGAALGAGAGGLQAAYDRDMADVPLAMLRGGIGGGILAPVLGAVGRRAAMQPSMAKHLTEGRGMLAGEVLGGLGGGQILSRAKPGMVSEMTSPSQGAMREYYESLSPEERMDMMRTASDQNVDTDIIALVKHAQTSKPYKNQLINFLKGAPNNVKQAFAIVLGKHPRLLKTAADIYGSTKLLGALKLNKIAGSVSMGGGALYIADEKTKPSEYAESFGSQAPEAFNGVLLRGYHFKDTRPSLNLAVQVQEYHDFHDALESGVYRLYNLKGTPKSALVISNPIDLCDAGRQWFPQNEKKRKAIRNDVASRHNQEPDSLSEYSLKDPEPDIERSHTSDRVAIFGNGDYLSSTKVMGEQVTEALLKGTVVYRKLMTDGTAAPRKGKGVFITKRGAHYFGSYPVEISELRTSGKVVRGKLTSTGGFQTKNFVIDPRSPINRPKRLRDQNLVIIPASWKWMPLKEERSSHDYLRTHEALSAIALDALGSMGASEAVARRAGQSMYAVDGARQTSKKEAMYRLAITHGIHVSAAEAMLKLAEVTGVCRAFVVAPQTVNAINYRVKTAQGMGAPQTPMGGPPAMAAPPPMEAPPQAPSAVDQAFQESMQGLQEQMGQLQAQLDVLTSVQQRAMEIEGGGAQQGMPPGMQPGMATDPRAQHMVVPPQPGPQGAMPPQPPPPQGAMPPQGGDPAMQDPAMQEQQQPPMPVMRTEEPSSQEIANQVSPGFLEQAGQLQETGAFDAGAIASLSKQPSLKTLGSQYAANLENSVDDLGRTLLTLYMQEPQLKEQLGDESFTTLETQLRDTFRGLGDLVLGLTHNTAMLEDNAVT